MTDHIVCKFEKQHYVPRFRSWSFSTYYVEFKLADHVDGRLAIRPLDNWSAGRHVKIKRCELYYLYQDKSNPKSYSTRICKHSNGCGLGSYCLSTHIKLTFRIPTKDEILELLNQTLLMSTPLHRLIYDYLI